MLNPNSKDLENANQNIVVSDQPVETNAACKCSNITTKADIKITSLIR